MAVETAHAGAPNFSFDVVVVGGGPAGGQCARLLAQKGYSVLLAERHLKFSDNDFSSAGTVLETLSQFKLPPEVVGSHWRKLTVQSSHARASWIAPKSKGVVLDFAKLKGFLAADAERSGCVLKMGWEFNHSTAVLGGTLLRFHDKATKELREVRARLVVDATGPARAVIKPGVEIQGSYLSAKGLEYLIEVGPEHDLPEELVFFLGHHWTPFGYAWIFPMGAGRLKVGAGQMCFEGRAAASKPLKFYIEQVIREYLGQPDFKMIDIHGATLRYSRGMKDRFYDRGIIAVGDAVSAVNPLGGEGIRHGMVSANHAAHALGDVLGGKVRPEEAYKNYEREMRSYFGWKWKLSELLMTRVYAGMSDSRIDRGVKRLARLGTGERGLDQMIDLLFYYRFYRFAGTVTRSLASRLLKSVPFSKIIERKGYN